ncbi:Eco57I restriction-modification methylase domain-containing protein [Staphylococcus hominis]
MITLSQKLNGVHYTNNELSKFIARRLLKYNQKKKINILDPACGQSDLLLAMVNYLNDEFDYTITGIDIDNNSLEHSKNIFKQMTKPIEYQFQKADFLEMFKEFSQGNLFNNNYYSQIPRPDIIIANPPYVRTQNMSEGKSKYLASELNITGKIDMYQAFIVAMINSLKDNGLIGFIVSNKFLYNKSGESTRNFLFKNLEILEIIDLGDSKPFEASVLPVIIIGKKRKSNNKNVKFQKVYESKDFSQISKALNLDIYAALDTNNDCIVLRNRSLFEITTGTIDIPENSHQLWSLSNSKDLDFINKIHKNSNYIFKDVANVRVGIKTTADSFFIDKKNDTFKYWNIENEIIYPLISSENAGKWRLNKCKPFKKIIYPYTINDNQLNQVIDINNFPNFKNYAINKSKKLKSRSYLINSGKKWYEHWVPQNFSQMKKNKIVFKDISESPCFALDTEGFLVNGNCFWITIKDKFNDDLIYLLLAIANSDLIEKYHRISFNNKLYSGKLRYNTQYINKYPLPIFDNELCKIIINKTKNLLSSKEELSKNKIKEINGYINKLYGF